jgi:hypothetical protein
MSHDANEIQAILASLHQQGEDLKPIYVYPVEGGGLLLTHTPLEDAVLLSVLRRHGPSPAQPPLLPDAPSVQE